MPYTVNYMPPGCIMLPPKRMFASLPPPPPPAGFYKDFSPPQRTHWPPVICGPPPPPPPVVKPILLQKKKLICIQDPYTGQDVTQEILHCSPIIPSTPANHIALIHSSAIPKVMKNHPPPEISWFEPPCLQGMYSSSAPCLCFGGPIVPWGPRIPTSKGSSGGSCRRQYSREYLLSLRHQPLSLNVPRGLPDLSLLYRNKSPSSTPQPECEKSTKTFRSDKKRTLIFRPRTRAVSMGEIDCNNKAASH